MHPTRRRGGNGRNADDDLDRVVAILAVACTAVTSEWALVAARVRRGHRAQPRPWSFLTPLTLSILLIGAGAAAFLDSVNAVHVTLAAVLASGLVVVGVALVLSAWFGRRRA